MYDPDYYDVDEDGNPEYHGHGPAREEPDCGGCNDSGMAWRRHRSRPCPSCQPTRIDQIRSAIYWRCRRLRWRVRQLLPGRTTFTDEPPF